MPTNWSDLILQCGGICSVTSTADSLTVRRGVSPMAPPTVRIKHITRSSSGSTRFPKLDECAHFHYENVELGPVKMGLCDERQDSSKTASFTGPEKENEQIGRWFCVRVISNGRLWTVRRSYENFRMLDRQLHRCVYDRKYSLLPELPPIDQLQKDTEDYLRHTLTTYLDRFSDLAGSLINCGPVLNWLELDNRGNRLIVPDDSAINTPAVAAAYVVRRYTAQATDEISFEVGDMISVIDMSPPEESVWWRGKKGFQVGFFPCECVEIIGDKIPHSLKVPKAPTKPVLRKHGKLIAFFRSFLLSRPSRRKLKQSGILKERVFGCDLGEHLLNTGREIPLVLKCCTEFIEEHGIVDGIYRLSGVNSNIQKLRLAFDEDRVPDLTDEAILQDIHCVASLLKMYFRELPNPLLTYQLYDKFVNAVQSEEEVRLLRLRDIVQQLPPPHYRTLEYLMLHLAKVAGHGGQTGMTPKNVAIVWAPNLLRSKDVEGGGVGALHVVGVQAVLTEYLIRYADLIFNEKLPAFNSPGPDENSPRRARPKSLAISTPTKLLSLEEARSRALSANLPPTQQKYIDVGGGPDNLPPKYHTVIDFPGGKHGSGKLKKSPSSWKSFFYRGWHSGSTREKERTRTQRKISSGSLQHTSLPAQDVAVTESDVSHTKKLRTVKSAESLVLLGGGSSYRDSGASESFSVSGASKGPSRQISIDYAESNNAKDVSNLSLKSPHLKHNRSSSHESYFEQEHGMDISQEEHEMEKDDNIFELMDRTISKMKEEADIDPFDYQAFCGSESDTLPLSDVSDNVQDDLSKELSVSAIKIVRKQKLQNVEPEAANAKVQKLSFKKFHQSLDSSVGKETYCRTSSNDDSSFSDTDSWKYLESTLDKSGRINMSSPDVSKHSYSEDDSSLECNKVENMKSENETIQPITQDTDDSRVVVERYGNEETVIVEVHATEDSSDEETDKSHNQVCSQNDSEDYNEIETVSDVSDQEDLKILSTNGEANRKLYENIADVINKNADSTNDVTVISSEIEKTDNDNFDIEENVSPVKDEIVVKDENSNKQKSPGSPDSLPYLKSGSFTSEIMEEYSLIRKSLDQTHFKDERATENSEVTLDTKNIEHISKNDQKSIQPILCKTENASTDKEAEEKLTENVNTDKEVVEKLINRVDVADRKVKIEMDKFLDMTFVNFKESSQQPAVKNSKVSEDIAKTTFIDDVQLRHTPNRTVISGLSEKKRNSEPEKPPVNIKYGYSTSSERKRVSDPPFHVPSQHVEKNTVKGLMLKFEQPVVKDVGDLMPDKHASVTKENITTKPKSSHPSLFTQLKVLKLQSLQSVISPTEPRDPWSDPILDVEEERSQYIPPQDRPSLIVQHDTNVEVSEKSEQDVIVPEENIMKNSRTITIQEQTVDKKHVNMGPSKERKCTLGLSVSTPDLADTSEAKVLDESICLDASVPSVHMPEEESFSNMPSNQTEDETVRRERINRIKEERRAQLREKLRSESFRLEAEEKEKVLNEFRFRKHSSGSKSGSIDATEEHTKCSVQKPIKDKKMTDTDESQCSKSKQETKEEIKNKATTFAPRTVYSRDGITPKKEKKDISPRNDSNNLHHSQETNHPKVTTNQSYKPSYKSPTKERLKKVASLDSPKQISSSDIQSTSQILKTNMRTVEKLEKVPLSSEKCNRPSNKNLDSRTNQRVSVSQKCIRERAAMFEHPKESQELCSNARTPSNRFARQRSSPSLTPSYVR